MLLLGVKCVTRKELPDRLGQCNVNAERVRRLVFLSEKILYASVSRLLVKAEIPGKEEAPCQTMMVAI
jgi:hypothetical protein